MLTCAKGCLISGTYLITHLIVSAENLKFENLKIKTCIRRSLPLAFCSKPQKFDLIDFEQFSLRVVRLLLMQTIAERNSAGDFLEAIELKGFLIVPNFTLKLRI